MFIPQRISREVTGSGVNLLMQLNTAQPSETIAQYADTVQAVYIDPPFMTGESFRRRRRFGEKGWKSGTPAPQFDCYEDAFESRETYLQMLRGMLENARTLLSDTGVVMVHLDYRSVAYARFLLDELFGEKHFVNEIIWSYESGGRATHFFSNKHDTILIYSKGNDYRFDITRVAVPRTETRKNHMKRCVDENGRTYGMIRSGGKEYRYYDDEPVYPSDVWADISHLQQRDPERTGYATQKPLKLLERLLKPFVVAGDTVADLCCGSGTTIAAAEQLGCQYLGFDRSPEALCVTRSRLEGNDLTFICYQTEDDTALEGLSDSHSGMIHLTSFIPYHPAFPTMKTALDALERYDCGRLKGDVLYVSATEKRSFREPKLVPLAMAAESEDPLCVSCVDAAGRYRVYKVVEEE